MTAYTKTITGVITLAEAIGKDTARTITDVITTADATGSFVEGYTTDKENNQADVNTALKTKLETLVNTATIIYVDVLKEGSMYIGVLLYTLN